MADSPPQHLPADATATPQLIPHRTLPCPAHARGAGPASRAWQSSAHPSPTAPLLAVASADKNVYIWSLRNFQLVSKIEGGHKRSVRCVEWKDYDGEGERKEGSRKRQKVTLATGSFDANVGVWEHARAGKRRGWGAQRANQDAGEMDVEDDNLEQEQDEGEDEEAEEWNFTTLLTGPDSEIKSMQFSPPHYSANLLATSSRDKSVWVWEEVEDEEWETIAVLQEHTGDVKCVRWCEGVRVALPPAAGGDNANNGGGAGMKTVGSRELLASASYDDTIRLWRDVEEEGDWTCISLLEGHKGTVWDLSWEKTLPLNLLPQGFQSWEAAARDEYLADYSPRLLSCSDDLTLKVWRRELSEAEKEKRATRRQQGATNGAGSSTSGGNMAGLSGISQRLPSIIRPTGHFETWIEEATLPKWHVRSVYSVDWSRKSGLVVSCGGDGGIVVYREVRVDDADVVMQDGDAQGQQDGSTQVVSERKTKWEIVAVAEAAHDEYEVNHVCWATRRDGDGDGEEEIIVSTGDEGDVKIWRLPEGL